MNEQIAIRHSSFAYSVNMLRMLRKMQLITNDEYEKIVDISAKYYDTDIYCV